MARTAANSVARGNSLHSSLGTVAPLNTPTPRFYSKHELVEVHEPGVPNPNVYVVQPFKNSSIPKDLVYAKKNAPNPGETLLNSTVELINNFTTCYETVKHQLQEEHTRIRESALMSRTAKTVDATNNTYSRTTLHKPAKQARLQPLIVSKYQQTLPVHRGPYIDDCVGILPIPVTKADDLIQLHDEKLDILHRLRPELFDNEGNLLSRKPPPLHSQASNPSSKKSTTSSYRTPHNTLLTNENFQNDDHRTFLTEFTSEENDNGNDNDEQKPMSLNATQQTNSVTDLLGNNYILKILDIKTITKRDRTKSASEKGSHHTRKESYTVKST